MSPPVSPGARSPSRLEALHDPSDGFGLRAYYTEAGRPHVKISDLATELVTRGFPCRVVGSADVDVQGVACDSRKIVRGDLFVALPGRTTDGRRFVDAALRAGAVGVVRDQVTPLDGVPGLVVDDPPRICGSLAAVVYGDPARRLTLVGVTGTNGKTSCTYLLESMWAAAGEPCGVIGTVSVRWPGHEEKAAMTTPDAPLLQAHLRTMVDAGCRAAAIEVSSHALSQHRVAGCVFRVAIFTNLTRDHLDFHGDQETYFSAKAALFFHHLGADGIAILNADDPYAMRLAERLPPKVVRTFSAQPGADAWAVPLDVRCGLDGLHGRIRVGDEVVRVDSPLIGLPNVSNVLAAAAAARALRVPSEAIARALRTRAAVPGRLERVGGAEPVVLVDYAHTPDALERTLMTTREMTAGRLIVVFGCGGDRDRGKRPIMGRVAADTADVVVLTSDNPRTEEPMSILRSVEEGLATTCAPMAAAELRRTSARGYLVEPDRERAIMIALELAQAKDVVVVAGKGHEDYQEVGGERRVFDDREVVRRLQAAGART